MERKLASLSRCDMKIYKISKWNETYENNRSRTVKDLSWVAIPNRHDGENFSSIMAHKDGAVIFSAFVLMVQVASRCQQRGTLMRDNGKPHTPATLATKTRAPEKWFVLAIEYLIKETDWIEVEDFAEDCQPPDSVTAPPCQSGDEERRERREGKGGEGSASLPVKTMADIVVMEWNSTPLPKCLEISTKRKQSLQSRLKEPFFVGKWKEALNKVVASKFCNGANERGWKANFDWFISPDAVIKIMEGKYDDRPNTKEPKPNDRNFGVGQDPNRVGSDIAAALEASNG